jgi:hypothetical protein
MKEHHCRIPHAVLYGVRPGAIAVVTEMGFDFVYNDTRCDYCDTAGRLVPPRVIELALLRADRSMR